MKKGIKFYDSSIFDVIIIFQNSERLTISRYFRYSDEDDSLILYSIFAN